MANGAAVLESQTDFCTEMKQKTKKIHDQSDKLINLKLAVVLTDTQLWGEVLLDFYHVFDTIEHALQQHRSHPNIEKMSKVVTQYLTRISAFNDDLTFYLGERWRHDYTASLIATEYCDHIWRAAERDPSLLIG